MGDLDEALNSAFDGEAGDPGETAAAAAPEGEGEDTAADAGDPEATPSAADDDTEPLFNREKYLAEHPELAPIAKQFQADYTRKMQELAEQRKQFEGLDEGTIAWVRYAEQLAATNPKAAADWLRQQAEALSSQPAPETDPYADDEFATDVERRLAQDTQQLRQEISQLKQFVNQQQIASNHADVERRFDQLAQAHGEIPFAERQQTIFAMDAQGVPLAALETFWRGQNVDKLIAGASRKARDEASSVVQRKAGIGAPPSGVAARERAGTQEPSTLDEALELAVPQ